MTKLFDVVCLWELKMVIPISECPSTRNRHCELIMPVPKFLELHICSIFYYFVQFNPSNFLETTIKQLSVNLIELGPNTFQLNINHAKNVIHFSVITSLPLALSNK